MTQDCQQNYYGHIQGMAVLCNIYFITSGMKDDKGDDFEEGEISDSSSPQTKRNNNNAVDVSLGQTRREPSPQSSEIIFQTVTQQEVASEKKRKNIHKEHKNKRPAYCGRDKQTNRQKNNNHQKLGVTAKRKNQKEDFVPPLAIQSTPPFYPIYSQPPPGFSSFAPPFSQPVRRSTANPYLYQSNQSFNVPPGMLPYISQPLMPDELLRSHLSLGRGPQPRIIPQYIGKNKFEQSLLGRQKEPLQEEASRRKSQSERNFEKHKEREWVNGLQKLGNRHQYPKRNQIQSDAKSRIRRYLKILSPQEQLNFLELVKSVLKLEGGGAEKNPWRDKLRQSFQKDLSFANSLVEGSEQGKLQVIKRALVALNMDWFWVVMKERRLSVWAMREETVRLVQAKDTLQSPFSLLKG